MTFSIQGYLVTEEIAQASLAAAEADLEATRIALTKATIRAVDDGVITVRSATLGNVVSVGSELFRLMRQSRVEWNAELDARQLALVRPGQTARLSSSLSVVMVGLAEKTGPPPEGDGPQVW